MRHRWRFRWGFLEDEPWPARLFAVLFGWVIVGFAGLVVGGIASSIITGNDQMNRALYIELAAGFGAPICIGAAIGLVAGALWLIRHPPIRRVAESSPDMREIYRQP